MNTILIALILTILVFYVMRKSECFQGFRNYVNMGSLTDNYNDANPGRRVSGPFMYRAPGE